MRCYNAAMSKPFQFSMRRMFVAVALFGAAAWLARVTFYAINNPTRNDGGTVAYSALVGCIVCGVAGCGTITETRIAKIVSPLILLVLIAAGIYVSVYFRQGDWLIIAVVAIWLFGKDPLGIVLNWWRRRRSSR
jgi:hypothetical protein